MWVQLGGCTTLTKCLKKKIDWNKTMMLQTVLNKSWKQHPIKPQLHSHLPPILQTIKKEKQDMLGITGQSKYKVISDILLWTPTHGHTSVVQPAKTYIHQLCEDTWWHLKDSPRGIADRDGWQERVSRESMLSACIDDDKAYDKLSPKGPVRRELFQLI